MTDCEKFQESALAGGVLSGPEAAHARECPHCAAFLGEVQELGEVLGREKPPAAPSRVRRALMEEFDRIHPGESPGHSPFLERITGLFHAPRLALAGAAAAVLLVFAARFAPERPAADGVWTVTVESYTVYSDPAEG